MSEKIRLTPDQDAAVTDRGGDLLVSAAAGSGKTKVLVERLLSKVTDSAENCDVDDFLIITYTRAAATELRSKIMDAIYERIAEDPENRRLRRQADICCNAKIGTIHSFCAGIIRENAHLLGISPDFRVADEAESNILRREILADVLEDRYDIGDPGFIALADTMGAGRDDSRLVEIILDTYSKLMSHPYPERWVRLQMDEVWDVEGKDASETIWGAYVMARAKSGVSYLISRMEGILNAAAENDDFLTAYGASIVATVDGMKRFLEALDGKWDTAAAAAELVSFPRPKPVKGYEDLKNIRTDSKKMLEKLTAPFSGRSKKLMADMAKVKPAVKALLELVLDFRAAYSAGKRRRNLLDFSDQEHFALRLLVDEEGGAPTPAAKEISKRYTEIMIDEYQDVNAVQELIFQTVSRGDNVFMVGDVKQSIYRFRLADPTIFLGKYQSFAAVEKAEVGEARKIILSMNFRSRVGVLDAVNFVFKNIMSADLGEMDYMEQEYLYPGAVYPESAEPCVELDVIDLAGDGEEDEFVDKTEEEARFVAERISELVGTMSVSDGKGGMRPLRFGDIAILMRFPSGKAGCYASFLAKSGIPSSMETGADFFDTIEISLVVSLLSVIDNPRQDIPLIAVMRSALYGFTADELAECRVCLKDEDFWSAVLKKAETDKKFADFADSIDRLRDNAVDMTADEILWHIYGELGLFAVTGAMEGGERRRNNLLKLLDMAKSVESTGYKGVFGFITYLRKLMQDGQTPEAVSSFGANAVAIMSIHKSKGLEFPVVFLADMARRFNTDDSKKPLLIHSELGVGPKYADLKRRIEYPTLAREAIKKKILLENLSEELRVLYVGMTRAKEKLIMTVAYNDAEKTLAKYADTPLPVPSQVVETGGSMAEWILRTALRRAEADALRFGRGNVPVSDGNKWCIRLIRSGAEDKAAETGLLAGEEKNAGTGEGDGDIPGLLDELGWSYPYASATKIPSKLTATELKGGAEDAEASEEAEKLLKITQRPPKRPSFMVEKRGLTAAEKGTAAHLVMQYAVYEKCVTEAGAAEEIERLRLMRTINDEQAVAVDPKMISSFFNSGIGRRLMAAERVWRELKFSLLVDSGEIPGMDAGEEMLLQGVVDCCFEEDGKLTVVDFKTDYVTKETLEEKVRFYTGQVSVYAMAMERILELPVAGSVLYFLTSGMIANI